MTIASVPRINTRISGNHLEFNRLIAAAIVNTSFRHLLLNEPLAALQAGYLGESFRLSNEECQLILSIRAMSLPEFALQLTTALQRDMPK